MKTGNKIITIFIPIAILVVVLFFFNTLTGHRSSVDSSALKEGKEYLESITTRNISEIQEATRQTARAKSAAQRAEYEKLLEDENTDPWTMFDGWLLIGDSRITDIGGFSLLPESQLLSGYGETIYFTRNNMDAIVAANPMKILLAFGLDDLVRTHTCWADDPDAYYQDFVEIIDELRSKLPDTEIYINDVLPIKSPATEKYDTWKNSNIEAYNAAVKQICEDNGFAYISAYDIGQEHLEDLYRDDGSHFMPELYTLWGKRILMTALDYEENMEDETWQTVNETGTDNQEIKETDSENEEDA